MEKQQQFDRRKRWITTKDVATMLAVTERDVRNRLASGDLPGVRYGRMWRIPAREFELWLERTEREELERHGYATGKGKGR